MVKKRSLLLVGIFPCLGGCLPSLIIEAQVEDTLALQRVLPYLQAEFFW